MQDENYLQLKSFSTMYYNSLKLQQVCYVYFCLHFTSSRSYCHHHHRIVILSTLLLTFSSPSSKLRFWYHRSPDHRRLSPVAAYAFAAVCSSVSAFVPSSNSEWQNRSYPDALNGVSFIVCPDCSPSERRQPQG